MKEDAIKNGQLKPAYNVQHGVNSEYIVWLIVDHRLTDTTTLIAFIKSVEALLHFKYSTITADAGYESEEGCKLIMNRSVQVEGSFGEIKQDMGFRDI